MTAAPRVDYSQRLLQLQERRFSLRYGSTALSGLLVVSLLLFAAIGWAATAPIAKGAKALGTLIVESKAKAVQHEFGGRVESVLVKEGQSVPAGAVLLTLDTGQDHARLLAFEGQMLAATERRSLIDEELKLYETLLARKLTTRTRVLGLKRRHAQIAQDIHRLKGQIALIQRRIKAAKVRAPVAGRVLRLAAHVAGQVLAPGATVLELVPGHDRLVVEARLSPADIDEVHAGMAARVWLSALNRRIARPLAGKVAWVSPDSITSPDGRSAHYRVRIELQRSGRTKKVPLYPGMRTEVLVVTGAETLIDQILDPIMRSFGRAFR